MSEPSQAERIAALKAKRAEMPAQTVREPTVVEAATEPRWRRLPRPAPQRVAAAGASIVSFAAMTAAMGPLTSPAVETAAADLSAADSIPVDEPTTVAPPETPEVLIEVVPNYVAVAADGTPLPDVALSADGTPINVTSEPEVEANTAAAPAAAPTQTTSPAATQTTVPAQPAVTTVAPATQTPTTAPAPATTAAPPPTTAAPPPTTTNPAATNPPPPPKSDASG